MHAVIWLLQWEKLRVACGAVMRLPSPVGEGGPLAVDEVYYYSSVIQLASRRVHDSFPHKGSHDCGGKLYPTLDIKVKLWLSFKELFVTVTFIILSALVIGVLVILEKTTVSIFSYFPDS